MRFAHDNEDDTAGFEDDERTETGLRGLRARVLVVDDDQRLREMIAARMRREAFEVVEAGSGYEALEMLHRTADEDIDLVVMDIRMPGTSGLEIVRMLRDADRHVPVLLISAFPDRDVVAEALRLDASLLAKPFLLDRLSEAAISTLLGNQRSGLA